MLGNLQHYTAKQNISLSVNLEQTNVTKGSGSSVTKKGKEAMTELGGRKSKKLPGSGKGKAKVIATGHQTTQKETWTKRGAGPVGEEQKGWKKPKTTGGNVQLEIISEPSVE